MPCRRQSIIWAIVGLVKWRHSYVQCQPFCSDFHVVTVRTCSMINHKPYTENQITHLSLRTQHNPNKSLWITNHLLLYHNCCLSCISPRARRRTSISISSDLVWRSKIGRRSAWTEWQDCLAPTKGYQSFSSSSVVTPKYAYTGLIIGLHPANERRRYFVTTSIIGWMQA